MALSKELVSQFAKLANDKKESNESTVTGVYRSFGGKDYVQLDGSDIWTPVDSTVSAENGDRVKVLVKEHAATITGNITSPSARSKDVNTLRDEVDEYGNIIHQMDNTITQQGNSIIQIDNIIHQQDNTINQHGNAINQQNNVIIQMDNIIKQHGNEINQQNNKIIQNSDNITSMNNTINQQGNNIVSMNNTINQQGNSISQLNNDIQQQSNTITQQGNTITQINDNITSMNNTINQQENIIYQQGNTINQQGNTISQHDNVILQQGNRIEEHNADITILNSGFSIIDGVLTGLSGAVINDLKTKVLNAEYAQIDFANINIAAVEKLFTDSGIIKDLIVQQGHITGELVGVTLKGDLIEANTLIADKIVIHGSDGLFYKLNILGNTIAAEQTNENSLNGSIITAQSITAEKIAVTDLVAFGATIGGFIIGQNSIHSISKSTVNSSGQGLYMDSEGQICFGDNNNHIKYYKDENDNYKLEVRLHELYIGSSEQNAENMIESWIRISADGITNKFTSTGGLNLLQNSVGLSGLRWWIKIGNGTATSVLIPNESESGSEFKITGGSNLTYIEQNYNTITDDGSDNSDGIEYSVSFKYKHQVNGTASECKVELFGDQTSIVILNSTSSVTKWTKVIYKYKAQSTQPKIRISVAYSDNNYDVFEITDLIISRGSNDVWSPYAFESVGETHRFDKEGLYISDYSKNTQNNVNLDHNALIFKNGNTVISELSQNRVYTNKGEFINGYKIGTKLNVGKIDENNIIEYIG